MHAKYPPKSGTAAQTTRHIKAVDSAPTVLYTPEGGLHGDDIMITLASGGSTHFHKSYWFPTHVFRLLPADKKKEVQDHHKRHGNKGNSKTAKTAKRTIKQLESEILQLKSTTPITPPQQVTCPDSLDNHLSVITKSYISQVAAATNSSIMGGRNEQAFKRSKNN